ncbi:L-lactate dehydrogenase [Candidatus Enterococcus ferrettii]|uniref:L-lactate dehydrogenase n=1 Tax=Candidatus Enterococcus ferrettii TaxID=2815324 RepID=A0ABV0EPZ4_9ENTE|nr:L-lactate dehydrogenase [Enterococcus sp. 665A]MBO1342153.1 L-lactate dehydrogenase [Enterococcus sp. 665A]
MAANKRIILIGTGSVGASYAFSVVNQNICDELVLIDLNEAKVNADVADIQDGLPNFSTNVDVWRGSYSDCKNADIVCICAGVPQKVGQTRLDLINTNIKIAQKITEEVIQSGFDGIFLIASNPVDIISYAVWKYSNFPKKRVIGSGTTLDTARLRYQLSRRLDLAPQDILANVFGEHGDSEFVPWSTVKIAGLNLSDVRERLEISNEELEGIYKRTRDAAYKIIQAKGATYYGIAMALSRISKAILKDEHAVLTTSTLLEGEYGQEDVFAGVPCVIGRRGVLETITPNLTPDELNQFAHSADVLRQNNPLCVSPQKIL